MTVNLALGFSRPPIRRHRLQQAFRTGGREAGPSVPKPLADLGDIVLETPVALVGIPEVLSASPRRVKHEFRLYRPSRSSLEAANIFSPDSSLTDIQRRLSAVDFVDHCRLSLPFLVIGIVLTPDYRQGTL